MRRAPHTLVDLSTTPDRANRRGRGEGGFSLIELLVVLVILGVIAAIAMPTTGNARRAAEAGTMVTAGGTIWRAITDHRVDHRGRMPAPANLASWSTTPGGETEFRSLAYDFAGADLGDPYIPRGKWPSNPRSGERIPVIASGAAAPLASSTVSGGVPHLRYSSDGTSGWLAGYIGTGKRVFCQWNAPGGPGDWVGGSLGAKQC